MSWRRPKPPIKGGSTPEEEEACSINIQISNFVKIRQVRAKFFHADKPTDERGRQTDMTKLVVAYRNFGNAPKTIFVLTLIISFSFRCDQRRNQKLSLQYSHTVGNFIPLRADVGSGIRVVILQETDTEVRGSYPEEETVLTADE